MSHSGHEKYVARCNWKLPVDMRLMRMLLIKLYLSLAQGCNCATKHMRVTK